MESANLNYSNNPCSAFMAAIVVSYDRLIGDRHYLGRTAVQKLVYFAKALGVPIPCSFEIYTYGPYSDAVTVSVDSMLADDVLMDTSKDPAVYSIYRPGHNAKEILTTYHDLLQPYQPMIDAVVSSLGEFKPSQLELVATLHFVHHRLKQTGRREPAKEQVIVEFQRLKKGKFPAAEVETFYDALKNAKLL